MKESQFISALCHRTQIFSLFFRKSEKNNNSRKLTQMENQ